MCIPIPEQTRLLKVSTLNTQMRTHGTICFTANLYVCFGACSWWVCTSLQIDFHGLLIWSDHLTSPLYAILSQQMKFPRAQRHENMTTEHFYDGTVPWKQIPSFVPLKAFQPRWDPLHNCHSLSLKGHLPIFVWNLFRIRGWWRKRGTVLLRLCDMSATYDNPCELHHRYHACWNTQSFWR